MTNDGRYGWLGMWDITVKDTQSGKEQKWQVRNRILNAALDELLKPLLGVAPNMQIRYLAVGSSDAAVVDNQTQLGNEIFRTPYQLQTQIAVGQMRTMFILRDYEAVGQIEEIGIFGGSSASMAANSGMLISRILWKRTKTASEEIQFLRTDSMIRG